MASGRDIAKRFRVSLSTANKAVNLLVQEGILYRLRGSGTYLKNDAVPKTLRIAIADCPLVPLPERVQKILNIHIDSALKYLMDVGCDVRVLTYPELMHPSVKNELLPKLDGLLVSCSYIDPESIRLLNASKTPYVVYRHDVPPLHPYSHVIYDVASGIKEAVENVNFCKGREPLIFYETTSSGQFLRDSWVRALSETGLDSSRIRMFPVDVFFREAECYRLVRVENDEFRGKILICTNDELAFSLANALSLERMEVGVDYAMIGYGDRETYGPQMPGGPLIASIGAPMRLMAEEACKLLLGIVRSPGGCLHSVSIPTTFTPRKSVSNIFRRGGES